jgi:hypothetical protein
MDFAGYVLPFSAPMDLPVMASQMRMEDEPHTEDVAIRDS